MISPGNKHWIVSLALIAALALAAPSLEDARELFVAKDGIPSEIIVSSSQDSGPGTLREALFMALRADHPVTIVLDADEIFLTSPLPPVSGPHPLTLHSENTPAVVHAPDRANTPVLRVLADDVTLRNLHFRGELQNVLWVSGKRFWLEQVTISGARTALEGHDVAELRILDSVFEHNVTGVRLAGGATGIISKNRFLAHEDTGLWVVSNEPLYMSREALIVRENRFEEDRQCIVLGNVQASIERNELLDFSKTGITLLAGASFVSGNRISKGKGAGIVSDRSRSTSIIDNEIDHNSTVGILIKSASHVTVDGNKLYDNGYGIATVLGEDVTTVISNNILLSHRVDGLLVIGDSPILEKNRAFGNRRAGIRLLDLVFGGERPIAATPRLVGNIVRGNGTDETVRGQYVVELR